MKSIAAIADEIKIKKGGIETFGFLTPGFVFELLKPSPQETVFAKYDFALEKTVYVPKIELEGKTYIPFPPNSPFLAGIKPPSRLIPPDSTTALVSEIISFIHSFADTSLQNERISALYTLYTYVFDVFPEAPYFHITGDLGSGKSRLGYDTIGALAYRAVRTCGAGSLASTLRLLNAIRGTLIIDEADFSKTAEKTSELVQALNMGYKCDTPVFRCELKGKKQVPEALYVFSPKIFISRGQLVDDALESRCLPMHMKERTRKDIPYILPDSFHEEALQLRNKLLAWRFQNIKNVRNDVDHSLEELEVPARTRLLMLLLSSVAQDEESRAMLKDYAMQIARGNALMRGESFVGEILAVLHKLYLSAPFSPFRIAISAVTDEANIDRDKKLKTRTVSKIMRNELQMNVEKIGGVVQVNVTVDELNAVFTKFGLDPVSPPDFPVEVK